MLAIEIIRHQIGGRGTKGDYQTSAIIPQVEPAIGNLHIHGVVEDIIRNQVGGGSPAGNVDPRTKPGDVAIDHLNPTHPTWDTNTGARTRTGKGMGSTIQANMTGA